MNLEEINRAIGSIRENAIEVKPAPLAVGLEEWSDYPTWVTPWKLGAGTPRRVLTVAPFSVMPAPMTRLEYSCVALALILEGYSEFQLRPDGWTSVLAGIQDYEHRHLAITGVSWIQADLAASHLDASLPSELQWEYLYSVWFEGREPTGQQKIRDLQECRNRFDHKCGKYGSSLVPDLIKLVEMGSAPAGQLTLYPGLFAELCRDYFDFDLYRQTGPIFEGVDPLNLVEAPPGSRSVRGLWSSFDRPSPADRWYVAADQRDRNFTFRCVWPQFLG